MVSNLIERMITITIKIRSDKNRFMTCGTHTVESSTVTASERQLASLLRAGLKETAARQMKHHGNGIIASSWDRTLNNNVVRQFKKDRINQRKKDTQ